MIYSLDPPKFSFQTLYQSCAKRTTNLQLRTALTAEWLRISVRGDEYSNAGATLAFQNLEIQASLNVTKADLENLYDRVLVRGGERPTYEALKKHGKYGRCPYCGQRDIKTLDHYLPKATFPEFSVLPTNLIPCCSDCNHDKSKHSPSSCSNQLFHPYFDNWTKFQILKADIHISSTIDVTYRINSEALPEDVSRRASTQFTQLKLGSLYAKQASVELVQRREVFQTIFATGGRDALESELRLEHQSRCKPFPNAWEPVLYLALAENEPFCNGGWKLIDEPQMLT